MSISALQNMLFAAQPGGPEITGLDKVGLVTQIGKLKSGQTNADGSNGIEGLMPDNITVINPEMLNQLPVDFKAELEKLLTALVSDAQQGEIEALDGQTDTENTIEASGLALGVEGNWQDQIINLEQVLPQTQAGELLSEPVQKAIARLTYLLNSNPEVLPDNAEQVIRDVVEKLQFKMETSGDFELPQQQNIENIAAEAADNKPVNPQLTESLDQSTQPQQPENTSENNNISENAANTVKQVVIETDNVKQVVELGVETDAAQEVETEDGETTLANLIEKHINQDSHKDIEEAIPEQTAGRAAGTVNQELPVNFADDMKQPVSADNDKSNMPENILFGNGKIKVSVEQGTDNAKSQTSTQMSYNNNIIEQIVPSADTQNTAEFKTEIANAETKPMPNNLREDTGVFVSEQIKTAIKNSADEGTNEITVRLNPPELGRVFIKLQEQDGHITGLLEFSRTETRAEVEQLLPQLVRSLQEAGVSVRRLDVVQSQPDNSSFEQSREQQAAQDYNGQQSPHFNHEQNGWGANVYQWLDDQIAQGRGYQEQLAYSDRGVNVLV